ncbi:MAG: alpha-amylase family glycosyl hydrolase [Anaeromyxobacter sp.]
MKASVVRVSRAALGMLVVALVACGGSGKKGTTPVDPGGDTTPPSMPAAVLAVSSGTTSITLTWSPSTDDVGVQRYAVTRTGGTQGEEIHSTTGTAVTAGALTPATTYTFTVRAYDAAGNGSEVTAPVSATTDPEPPDPEPTNSATVYYAPQSGWTTVKIHYGIGSTWTTPPGVDMDDACTGWKKKLVDLGTASTFAVTFNNGAGAWDNNGGNNYTLGTGVTTVQDGTVTAGATSPCGGTDVDTTPPSVPQGVSAAANGTSVTVTWSASTDDHGVSGYEITRTGGAEGAVVATSASTSFTVSGLTASTTYHFTVKAFDAAGNQSAASEGADATTGAVSTAIRIYYKASSATTIWTWEPGYRALSQLAGHSWPGPAMTADPENPGWLYWELPAAYAPFEHALAFLFAGTQNQINLPGPVTKSMWWNGTAWSDHNPDPPAAPVVVVSPNGGWFGTATSTSATITVSASAQAPVTAMTYRIGTGAVTPFSASPFTVVVPLSATPVTVTVAATNSVGTTSVTTQGFQQGTQPVPSFSWRNATVYFVMTDRFVNGDPANDGAYGRVKVDATGSNIGTFHGGDLKGLKQKVDDDYFTSLGINAIWITAPYEQMHGWTGGGDAGDFAHFAYHGYYALDWTNLDASMGTPADLKAFVDAAHAKGIRVVFDVVMNHTGYGTLRDMADFDFGGKKASFDPAWVPGAGQTWHSWNDLMIDYASTSVEAAWQKWWGKPWIRSGIVGYDACGGGDILKCLSGLPDVKTESADLVGLPAFLASKATFGKGYLQAYSASGTKRPRDWQVEWLCRWVRDYGIDGFRVDTVKHVENDTWGAMKTACVQALKDWRTANPTAAGAGWTDDFWDTGEVFGRGAVGYDSNFYGTGKFDSLLNFGFGGAASGASGSAAALAGLESTYSGYAAQLNTDKGQTWSILTFIDNHDQPSLFFNGDLERQKRAGSALLMCPGPVHLYYGDEYGRAYGATGSDPNQGTRSDMNWTTVTAQAADAASTLSHWRKLGSFRKAHIAVGAGDHKQVTDVTSGYAFTRSWNADKVAVVLGGSGSVTVNVSTVFGDGASVRNTYDGTTATVSGGHVTFSAGTNGVILIEAAN